MATISVATTVAARLKVLLTAALATSGYEGRIVNVHDGLPLQFTTWDECVIGDIENGLHEFASIRAGRKTRDERYMQRVHFRVIRPGSEVTPARDAAIAQMSELEDIIADDPAIGLMATNPTLRLQFGEWHLNCTPEAASEGWLCNLGINVLVKSRLN